MPTEKEIYQTAGERYEALVACEDYQGNLLHTLRQLCPLAGSLVYDLGAGTGRFATLLAPHARQVHAFDISPEMLRVCRTKLHLGGWQNCTASLADSRCLPVPSASADLVVSGWSVAYLYDWNPTSWRQALETWLMEMQRVLKPSGTLVLFESLGTGHETPIRLPHLSGYYPWLERAGFDHCVLRTDYRFDSLDQAAELTGFFFGAEFGQRVRTQGWRIVPECTGAWWLRFPPGRTLT